MARSRYVPGTGWVPVDDSAARTFDVPNISTEGTDPRKRYPVVSRALPRNLPGVPCNAKGQPIITSRRHEQELCSRFGFYRYED